MTSTDESWMGEAIHMARAGEGFVEPNPMVGCVLVRDGRCIGRGYHARYGGPHAEVVALADCIATGHSPRGATVYVTLEPCSHFGKTPPCVDALIDAGVARVVIATLDPFPAVNGRGVQKLIDAGIEVRTGVDEPEVRQVLAPYLKRLQTGRPWVIAKWAMSLDGRIATMTGQSKWITGARARGEVHDLRSRVDAIAVGMGTVLHDDPQLTVRLPSPRDPVDPRRLPARIVFSRHRLPEPKHRLVATAAHVPTWVLAGPAVSQGDLAFLADHEVETWQAQSDDPAEMILEALAYLGSPQNPFAMPITNLMVEGGGELLGSFAAAGQIDEVHVFIGGKLIGGRLAPGPIGDPGSPCLPRDGQFQLIGCDALDDDARLIYRRTDADEGG